MQTGYQRWFNLNMIGHNYQFLEVHLVQWLSSEEIELATQTQILDEAICISLCINAFEKDTNPSVLRFTSNRKL